VSSAPGEDGEYRRHHQLAGCDFDELVVSNWLHIEEQDTGLWWMNFGGVVVHVQADRDGRPVRVAVHGPGDYDGAIPGVRYQLNWGEHMEAFTGGQEQA
jgi:hypothetical protein